MKVSTQNKANRPTVAVAMSGGVDSSVAAALLKQLDYYVIGLTMHVWDYDRVGGNVVNESSCCSLEAMDDARSVCHSLGIPHYVIDVRDEFEQNVISNFISEYLKGRTPNPCILCNTKIKWEVLLKKAIMLGCDFFATGHYARIHFDPHRNRYLLYRGVDVSKDQAYALWGLVQEQLKRTIFPLGDLTKAQVRKIANKLQLKTKRKPESQEICFIPDHDYPRFLQQRHPDFFSDLSQGEILDRKGKLLGYHCGFPFFTIGQRRGLGIAVGKPLYVTAIEPESNKIIVDEREGLNARGLVARDVNWIAIERLDSPLEVEAQIRYNDAGRSATVYPAQEGTIKVVFNTIHQAVTPGQSVVFFDGNLVVGGAIIEQSIT